MDIWQRGKRRNVTVQIKHLLKYTECDKKRDDFLISGGNKCVNSAFV